MIYPPLLSLKDQKEYNKYWIENYCREGLQTFDHIIVYFRKEDFDHAFFESVKSKDDTFSLKRAERMNWISAALKDAESEIYTGWIKKKKGYDNSRRVAIVKENYVVVIALSKNNKQAKFITAFVGDTSSAPGTFSTIEKIRKGPKWERKTPLICQAGSAVEAF